MAQRLVPRRIVVKENLGARYGSDGRPVIWEKRSPSNEKIRTIDGEEVLLNSAGGQSSPAPGWELLLTKEAPQGGFFWTLYGLTPQTGRNSRLI